MGIAIEAGAIVLGSSPKNVYAQVCVCLWIILLFWETFVYINLRFSCREWLLVSLLSVQISISVFADMNKYLVNVYA